jgi:hypothetical protein
MQRGREAILTFLVLMTSLTVDTWHLVLLPWEIGGSAWESNPPRTGLPPRNGFEDREAHRDLSAPLHL